MRYVARVTKEGRNFLAAFPDCPGCQTFAPSMKELAVMAQEALEGWLEAHLVGRDVAPLPKARHRKGDILVIISPRLDAAVQLRHLRSEQGFTQADLAKRMGVSQQQVAKLEDPDANPSLETLSKAFHALGAEVEITVRVA